MCCLELSPSISVQVHASTDILGTGMCVGMCRRVRCMYTHDRSESFIHWLACVCQTPSVLTLCNPMDCTCQAPPSMGFSKQEYWSGLPFPTLGRGSSPPGERTHLSYVSCIGRWVLYHLAPPGKTLNRIWHEWWTLESEL